MKRTYLLLLGLVNTGACAPLMERYAEPSFAVLGTQPELFAAVRGVAAANAWTLSWSAPRRGHLEAIQPRGEAAPVRWRFRVEQDRVAVERAYLAGETGSWVTPGYVGAGCTYRDEEAIIRAVVADLAGPGDAATLLAWW